MNYAIKIFLFPLSAFSATKSSEEKQRWHVQVSWPWGREGCPWDGCRGGFGAPARDTQKWLLVVKKAGKQLLMVLQYF